MNTIYTSEQIKKELAELRREKEEIRNNRVAALSKYQKKSSGEINASGLLHNIERKIENLERKLDSLL